MSKPILVANWKNHPNSLSEAKSILKELSKCSKVYKKTNLFIAPPAPFIDLVAQRIRSFASLGSQDFPASKDGSHTGELSREILKSFGVKLAIVGHSERRTLGETSGVIADKVKNALKAGIVPVVCVGEVIRDQDGDHFEFLREQLEASLAGIPSRNISSNIVIAYEPVWAIGKTSLDAITAKDLSESVLFIRKVLTNIFGRKVAERVPVLYGGSVEATNASALYAETPIRGFLVGHASLEPKNFKIIAESLK